LFKAYGADDDKRLNIPGEVGFLIHSLKVETAYLRELLTRPITNQGFINESEGNLSLKPLAIIRLNRSYKARL